MYIMENYSTANYNKEEAYIRAKKRLDKLKGFYWHLFWYIVVNAFLLVSIASGLEEGEQFWRFVHFSTPIFWGIGLFFHFMGVYGPNFLFGKQWEEDKIKEFMEKDDSSLQKTQHWK